MANAGFTSVDEALGELQCLHMQLVERNAEINELRALLKEFIPYYEEYEEDFQQRIREALDEA
jgi:hypothetical protein